ncbi:MAG: hypothetical protein ACW99G_20300, partial [Candidatus Thorarchaeota archaeon]
FNYTRLFAQINTIYRSSIARMCSMISPIIFTRISQVSETMVPANAQRQAYQDRSQGGQKIAAIPMRS